MSLPGKNSPLLLIAKMSNMEIINLPFETLDLAEDQRSNKIFSSILKTLLVNKNRYMTAKEIVGKESFYLQTFK